MSWVNVYINYKKNGDLNSCPICGKNEVTVDVIKKSLTFSCKSCGHFKHYDELNNNTEEN